MKRITKIILIFLGIGAIVAIVIWGLNSNPPAYKKVDSKRPFKGNAEAQTVLIEFSDFQCPACKSAAAFVAALAERYKEKIKIEFRYFPLVSIHPNSFDAALAAECANDQGKFWEMHDIIFNNQDNLNKNNLKSFAGKIERIDPVSFNACFDSRAKTDVINQDISKGYSLGVSGTPTFFLNGEEVEDLANLENLIRNALNQSR